MSKQGLTVAQEAYCRARAMGMDMAEALAASNSKITARTALGWEKKPFIRERIAELSQIASNNAIMKSGIDRTWVIENLKKVALRCMQEVPVTDRLGRPTGEFKFDAGGANAALRMLGETVGLFGKKDDKPTDPLSQMQDDDIARLASALAEELGISHAAPGIEAAQGSQQIIDVQALPAPDGVPCSGGEVQREAVQGGQPAWEDVVERVRDRVPHDGAVPGVVGGQAVV